MKGKKTGGRKKGTPNKLTEDMRASLSHVLKDEISILPELLKELQPHHRANIILKLAQIIIPPPSEQDEKKDLSGCVIDWGGRLIHV